MFRNQRIKESLTARGVTRERLAQELGVTHATITQRLNSDKDIDSIEFITAVAKLTGYSFSYLVTGIESDEVHHSTLAAEPSENYNTLRAENERLNLEIKILRSALREIGAGRGTLGSTPESDVG